jgi:hypothetical protein
MGQCMFSYHHLPVFLNGGGEVGDDRRCPDIFFLPALTFLKNL